MTTIQRLRGPRSRCRLRLLASSLLIACALSAGATLTFAAPTPTPSAKPASTAAPRSATPQPNPALTATPAGTPAITPTPAHSMTPTATSTTTATPTTTASPTQLPPTPTAMRLTPAPSGYFVPSYVGQNPAPGLESGVIRGRVLDYRGFGIANVPVSLAGNNVSLQTSCGADGGFAFGGLKPAVYNLTLGGYPADPAGGIYVTGGQLVTVDFVEAEKPGSRTPAPSAVAGTRTAGPDVTAKSGSSVVVVVLTPEGGGSIERPTSTPRPTVSAGTLDVLPHFDNPLQSFGVGIVGSCVLVALAFLAMGARR